MVTPSCGRTLFPVVLSVIVLCGSGCGGALATADGGDLPDSGSGKPDGGAGGRNPACPESFPMAQSTCGPILTQCEYGDALRIICDDIAICDADNSWSLSVRSCNNDAGAACPATAVAGQPCPQRGVVCAYEANVRECPVDSNLPQLWRPFPEPGCPYPRPRVGDLCSTENMYCHYATCDASVHCDKGIWLPGGGSCPP